MLQSIKQLYGIKLGASDGEIGQLTDLYFDDRSWTVRYAIAGTGSWLPGRQVLLSPHAFGGIIHQSEKVISVNLSRKQIENAPSIDRHKPVSRQYEEEYHRYYGWPFYWQGDSIWGMGGFPILQLPANPLPNKPDTTTAGPQPERADAHLRSTQAVNGYHIHATDGTIGHVCDFMMDNQSWAIIHLAVKTGHRFSGNELEIPTSRVSRISYEESTVFVSMSVQDVEQSPSHVLAAAPVAS